MTHGIRHLRSLGIALIALALSASLALGATPPSASWGLSNAATHAGKTVPVVGDETLGEDDETAGEDEDVEETEDLEEDVESEEAGDNCTTDPTALTPEQLAEMNHGSVVCWAATQTEWPEWFSNHGSFVRCWAHQGKADAVSCTEDPAAEDTSVDETTDTTEDATAPTHGKGQGKGKGKSKHQD